MFCDFSALHGVGCPDGKDIQSVLLLLLLLIWLEYHCSFRNTIDFYLSKTFCLSDDCEWLVCPATKGVDILIGTNLEETALLINSLICVYTTMIILVS